MSDKRISMPLERDSDKIASKDAKPSDRQKVAKRSGFLISFEGLDGSGKSTQFKIFSCWLAAQGYEVVTTKWKSSPLLAPYIKMRKEAKSLNPEEFSLLHAADFFFRLESLILPALNEGKFVICDRYAFTSLSRDTVRGIDAAWLLDLYQPIVWPDLVFYFSISTEASLQRITAKRTPKYYEAGQDMTKLISPSESFKIFGQEALEKYEAMVDKFNFVRVNAEQPIEVQQQYIRRIFRETLERVYERSASPSTDKFFSRIDAL